MVVRRDDRTRYIEALKKADAEDLRPLIAVFVEAQRNAVIQAAAVADDVGPITSAQEAIAAVLFTVARRRSQEIVGELREDIGSLSGGYVFEVTAGSSYR
jgi:hypothetical protein